MEFYKLLQYVQKLEIHCKRIAGQKLSGIFISRFKGRGMILDSVRKYDVADDVRNINWSVTAKFLETHVNTYIEDKEQLFWIIIDVSKSSIFGTGLLNKLDLTIQIAASIAYSALESKNAVGIIFFNQNIKSIIPPARGKNHFWRIAKELVNTQPSGTGTDLSKTLSYLSKTLKKPSNLFIISDFMTEGYAPICKILAQKHEISAVRVYDSAELNLPPLGWLKLKDAENDRSYWFNSSKSEFNGHYGIAHTHQVAEFDFFAQNGHKSVSLSTGSENLSQLIDFLQR